MGLITIANIEDGIDATGNEFNQRFGKIVDLLNGNIDSANLANQAVTTPKLADGAVTSAKLLTNRYIDDNGWTVLDLGGTKTYTKEFATSGTITLSEGTRAEVGNTLPPIGRTRANISIVTTWYGGYSGHVIVGVEDSAGASITCQIAHNWPYPLTMSGRAILIATDKI